MKSFRSELEDLENPIVEKDIIELGDKIQLFNTGKIDEEKFRSLRLARGVYGQRQQGVQMIRIKLPFGKMTTRQLLRIADVADEYSTGNLHTTTRQDIQIHYVSLDRTPQLWAELEKDQITLREACGNTVRNVTASALAGVDPHEAFDVTPYAQATFEYFLRNPVCQDMGRKFKIAFSASETDSAFTFIHDLGLIPQVREENGKEIRGFKVLIGGGLGSQPRVADVVNDFLPADQLIPFTEALLRVFDRHGERAKRLKARLKFLIKDIGIEEFLKLVDEEQKAVAVSSFPIDGKTEAPDLPFVDALPNYVVKDVAKYQAWTKTNVHAQKQSGYFAVTIKLTTGDFSTATARKLADLVKARAADDIRVTINQGLALRFVRTEDLPFLFEGLNSLGLAEPGFDSVADITSCPGTDTCNLGISNSTGIAKVLENVITQEYQELIYNRDIKIKISGCMNSCGHHALANIGFHGSTVKVGALVAPALQVLLGGGLSHEENKLGQISDKVIKVPSKRGPEVLRSVLDDYENNANDGEYFNSYYERQGKMYFYELLKPLANTENLIDDDFVDWGHDKPFAKQVGVGECAGVTFDLVSTLLLETGEKIELAKSTLDAKAWSDSIYHSYNTFINGAKSLLVSKQVKTNSQANIIKDFDAHFVDSGEVELSTSFAQLVYQIKENEPHADFAKWYYQEAENFYQIVLKTREKQLNHVN